MQVYNTDNTVATIRKHSQPPCDALTTDCTLPLTYCYDLLRTCDVIFGMLNHDLVAQY